MTDQLPNPSPVSLKRYFSLRNNKKGIEATFQNLLLSFKSLYQEFYRCGYFNEAFGMHCVDQGFVHGSLGPLPFENFQILSSVKIKVSLLDEISDFNQEQLFDTIEFLTEIVSKPIAGDHHPWNDCGWHFTKYDRKSGLIEWVENINALFDFYNEYYRLNMDGEIYQYSGSEVDELMKVEVHTNDAKNVREKVDHAVRKFRDRHTIISDRKDAIRDLADVLEFLKKSQELNILMTKDESDLFNIVNNFGIRHHTPSQKTDYDEKIWLSWMFHFYLASIHAITRLIAKNKK